jgi:hypothetical protein
VIAFMPHSAYDFSIRESLQRNRKAALAVAAILFLAAIAISVYYLRPRGDRSDPTKAFYSDDDGQTYFKDSVYNFPPFDHNGKTAVEAMLAESNGHYFVGYLMRFTPAARKQLQDKYDEAGRDNLPGQQNVLDFMASPDITESGMQVKLPGPGHPWLPRSQVGSLAVKAPNGDPPDRYVMP